MGKKNRQGVPGLLLLISVVISVIIFPSAFSLDALRAENSESSSNDLACILDVTPLKYEINLDPIKLASNYNETHSDGCATNYAHVSAWVKIKIKVGENNYCNILKLNTRNCKVDISNVNATKMDDFTLKPLQILNQTLQVRNNTVDEFTEPVAEHFIHLEDSLVFGDLVEIYIPYELELSREYFEESWQGIYYYDARGLNASVPGILYNFYPMHAPFMFPAFDHIHPSNKPTVKITVARSHSDGFISVSNMDIVETIDISGMDGWVRDHFRESPPIQLDQVTLMISQGFHNHTVYGDPDNKNSSSNLTEASQSVTVWTFGQDNFENGNKSVALGSAQEIWRLLNFYQMQFNGTKYPLTKIDFVAIPWATGGLKLHSNLGIVIAETELLMWTRSEDALENGKNLQVHGFLRTQITLQWFRGMISSGLPSSPAYSQEDIWISGEGLARYVANWALDNAINIQDVSTNYQPWLNTGKNFLEMMDSVFSQKIMKSAIAHFYLPKKIMKDAFVEDLYDSIQEALEFQNATHLLPAENVTVRDILTTWTDNRYLYPLIKISEVKTNSSCLSLYQETVSLVDPPVRPWWVPIKLLTETGEEILWVSPNNTSTNTSLIWCSSAIDTVRKWVFVNPDSTGYYTVYYSETLLKHLITQLNVDHMIFPPVARNYLLYNQFTVAKTNDWDDLKGALELTRYLHKELDLNVWTTVLGMMKRFHSQFLDRPNPFQKYVGNKMNTVLEKLGIKPIIGENIINTLLRLKFFEECSSYKIPLCVDFASGLLTDWMNNATQKNPFSHVRWQIREQLFCAAVGSPSEDLNSHPAFHFLLEKLFKMVDYDEEDFEMGIEIGDICTALTCVNNDTLLAGLLNNSKLATSSKWKLQHCYQEDIPYSILYKRPKTMMQAVYDFWMRDALTGGWGPASFMRHCWSLVPRSYEPVGFVESILKFINDHDDLFVGDLVDNVKNFKDVITTLPNFYNELWKENGIGSKMVTWFNASY